MNNAATTICPVHRRGPVARVVAVIAILLVSAAMGSTPAASQSSGPPRGGLIDDLARIAGGSAAPGTPQGAEPEAGKALSLGDVQSAWSQTCNRQPGIANAVVTWDYKANEARCVVVRETMFTTVLLPEFDRVVDIYVGDSRSFEVRAAPKRPNVVLIRPKGGIIGVDTQVTVIGEAVNGAGVGEQAPWSSAEGGRNVYTFYVRSVGIDHPNRTNVTVFVRADLPNAGIQSALGSLPPPVDEVVPFDAMQEAAAPADPGREFGPDGEVEEDEPDYVRKIPYDVNALTFDVFTIYARDEDSASIAPKRVFTDGVFTFIDYGEDRADTILRPVVFQVIDGIDNQVNSRSGGPKNNILIVEGVGDFTLRNGARVVCLRYRKKPPIPDAVIIGSPAGVSPGGSAPPPSAAPEPVYRAKPPATGPQTPPPLDGI